MENNNPHLQKKRSSRLTFGRSLIRRIAEIPESMSLQGSRKDKDTSGAGGTLKGSGSCLATSESARVIMRSETAKPSPERQKCLPLRDASVKNCTNKRASETESIDTAPLFCKSVSAQNLALDNNFLHPVSTRVQKSFSFTEKHRDHYPRSPAKSTVDTSRVLKTSPKDKSFDKAEVKEEQPTGTNTSNQANVTCALSEQETLTQKLTSPPTLLYVCPWEFASSLPSSSPPVAKGGSSLDSDVESSRPNPPISSSAPGSPYSFAKPMASCGISFHSATQTLLLARGLVAKKGSGRYSSKNELEGTSQHTRSVTLSSAIKSGKKTPQAPIRSMTCVDSKPCLVKQAAIRASPERNSVSTVPPRIHLWESEDVEYENIIQCQNSGRTRLCLTPSIERTNPSWHHDKASLTVPRSTGCRWDVPNKTCRQSSIADICPWEAKKEDQLQPKGFCDDDLTCEVDSKHMQITTGDKRIRPWEPLGQTSRISSKARKGTEQHQSHTEAEVFPCNVKEDSAKSVSEATKPTERVIYVNPQPDTKKQSRQETLRTDICPWETKSLTTPSPRHRLTKQLTGTADMDICPWDFPEGSSCQLEKLPKTDAENPSDDVKKTKSAPNPPTKQLTSTAETCPWDFPDSPSIVKEVYLLETEEASLKPNQEDMGLPSQVSTTKKTHSCSQEADTTGRSEGITITKEADTSVLQKESVHAKICLWETITLESEQPGKSSQKQTGLHVNVDPVHTGEPEKQIQKTKNAYAEICPWETEQSPKKPQSPNYLQAYICPWELEVSGKSKMQTSVCVDISLWGTERPASTKDSVSEKTEEDTCAHTVQRAKANPPLTRCDALCPWEMKGGSIEHDNNSDIFTWEEPIAEEESDAETAAEAFIFPPDS